MRQVENATHGELQKTLAQFMSETAARVVLRSTLESMHVQPANLTPKELPQVVEGLIVGARLFVPSAEREKFSEQLRRLAGGSAPTAEASITERVEVRTENDASTARLNARLLCERVGGRPLVSHKFATGVSELARNQLMYAGGGTIELIATRNPRPVVRAVATDTGKGIPNVEEILSGKYRSRTGMGLGLLGTRRMADQFDIKTGPGGTVVTFEVVL